MGTELDRIQRPATFREQNRTEAVLETMGELDLRTRSSQSRQVLGSQSNPFVINWIQEPVPLRRSEIL